MEIYGIFNMNDPLQLRLHSSVVYTSIEVAEGIKNNYMRLFKQPYIVRKIEVDTRSEIKME